MKYITILSLLHIVCCSTSFAIGLSHTKQSTCKGVPFALSHDKKQIVTHTSDQTSVYNRSDLRQTARRRYWKKWLQTQLGLRKKMESQQLACSSKENVIATVLDNKMIEVSRYEDGTLKPEHRFRLKHTPANISSVCFPGGGITLAVGCDNGTVHTLHVSKDGAFRKKKYAIAENSVVSALAASCSGRRKVVALCKNGDTSEVKVFEVDERPRDDNRIGRSLNPSKCTSKHYAPDESGIISLACSPRGNYFATVDESGKVQVCKIGSKEHTPVAEWKSDGVCSVAFDGSHRHLLVGHVDQQGPRIERVDFSEALSQGELHA